MEANYVHKDSTTLVQDELVKNELNQIELQYNTLKQQKFNELLKENQKLKDRDLIIAAELTKLQDENKQLKQKYEMQKDSNKLLCKAITCDDCNCKVCEAHKDNIELKKENKQLKDLIDTILNFSFFKEECPLNFGFENNTNEDKSQSIFYGDEWCENNCNDNYKDCWLKYFKKLQEIEGSDE